MITATRHSTLPPGVKASTAPCIGYGSGWSAWRPSGRHKARPIAAIRYVDSYQVKEAGAHRGRATLALANLAGLNCLDLVGVDADCHKQGKGGGLLRQSLDCLVWSGCKGISGEIARQGFTRRAFRLHLDSSLLPFHSFGKWQLVCGRFVMISVWYLPRVVILN